MTTIYNTQPTPADYSDPGVHVEVGTFLDRDAMVQIARLAGASGVNVDRLLYDLSNYSANLQGGFGGANTGAGIPIESLLRANPALMRAAEELCGGRLDLSGPDGRILFLGPEAASVATATTGDMISTNVGTIAAVPGGSNAHDALVASLQKGSTRDAMIQKVLQDDGVQAAIAKLNDATSNDVDVDLSFLDDPSLDIETKLMMYLSAMMDKKQEELEKMLAREKNSGLFDKLKGMVSAAVTAAATIAGGPAAGTIAQGAMTALEEMGAFDAIDGSGGDSEQQRNMKMQQLTNERQQLSSMVSNMLQSSHSTAMTVIGNMRG